MRHIKKKNSRKARKPAKSAKVSNRQNMYIIAGLLAVVVISGIMLSQTDLLMAKNGQMMDSLEKGAQTDATATEDQAVKASIKIVNSPNSFYTNVPVSFIWEIESDAELQIPHTALHYDTRSVPSPSSYTDYRLAGRFMDGMVPGTFSDSITILEPGTYYYRAHAVVDGMEIWSDEQTFVVTNRFG